MPIKAVYKKGEEATRSNANNKVITGVSPKAIASVFFLYILTMYFPITKVVQISAIPITKLLTPKLYPILLIAY